MKETQQCDKIIEISSSVSSNIESSFEIEPIYNEKRKNVCKTSTQKEEEELEVLQTESGNSNFEKT